MEVRWYKKILIIFQKSLKIYEKSKAYKTTLIFNLFFYLLGGVALATLIINLIKVLENNKVAFGVEQNNTGYAIEVLLVAISIGSAILSILYTTLLESTYNFLYIKEKIKNKSSAVNDEREYETQLVKILGAFTTILVYTIVFVCIIFGASGKFIAVVKAEYIFLILMIISVVGIYIIFLFLKFLWRKLKGIKQLSGLKKMIKFTVSKILTVIFILAVIGIAVALIFIGIMIGMAIS